MAKVPKFNKGPTVMHVGPISIPPGGCRLVEDTDLPDYKAARAPSPPVVDAVLALLDLSIKKMQPKLDDLAPADLDRLEKAERNGKTRQGVIEAIEEVRLRRAAEAAADQRQAELLALSSEELAQLAKDTDDDALRSQIEEILGAREDQPQA